MHHCVNSKLFPSFSENSLPIYFHTTRQKLTVSSILHSVSREIRALVINDRTMKCNQRTSTIYTEKYLLFRIADSCTKHRGCNNLNNDGARPVNTDLVQYASQCLRYAALRVPQLFDKLTPVETVPTEHVASRRSSLSSLSLSLSLAIFFYIHAAHISNVSIFLSFFFFNLQTS